LFGRGRKKNVNASDSGPLGSPQHRSVSSILWQISHGSPRD
jgi:hypothetical protein